MDTIAQVYEHLIERFQQWAVHEEHIRAALVLGSRARTDDHPADEWADLDLMVMTKDPDKLVNDSTWVAHVGVPVLNFVENTASGQDSDFLITSNIRDFQQTDLRFDQLQVITPGAFVKTWRAHYATSR